MLDIMRDMIKNIDKALERAYEEAEMFINYVSTFTFTPTDWIDSKSFNDDLYISTDMNGAIEIYDSKLDKHYSVSELDFHSTFYFVYRFIELIEAGILKIKRR
jgi:hypothetical protein